MSSRLRRNDWALLFLLFTVSFSVRILLINNGLFHSDSVALAMSAESIVEQGRFETAASGKFGMVIINAAAYMMSHHLLRAESAELTVTLVVILLSSLSVCLLYLVVLNLTDSAFASFSAAMLFALNNLFLSVSTYAKSHGPSLFFAFTVIYILTRPAWKGSRRDITILAAASTYMLLVRPDTLLYVVPLGLLCLFRRQLLDELRGIAHRSCKNKFACLAVVIAIPLVLAIGNVWVPGLLFIRKTDMLQQATLSVYSSHFLKACLQLVNSLTLPVVLAVAASYLYVILRRMKWTALFAIVWFLAIFLPMGLSRVASPRLFVGALAPLFLVLGIGLNEVYRRERLVSVTILIILCFSMLFAAYPVVAFRHANCGPKQFGLMVKNTTEQNAVVIANDMAAFVNYYGNRSTISYPVYGNAEEVRATVGFIHSLIDKGVPVYVPSHIFYMTPDKSPERTLKGNFKLSKVGEVVAEDYHHAELELRPLLVVLHRLETKENMTEENMVVYASR
jgi:hypothetical protein